MASAAETKIGGNALRQVEAGIAGSALLKALTATGRKRLAAAGRLVTFEPGDMIIAKGDEGNAMYVVLAGEVEIRSDFTDGRELRFASVGVGGLVGEMAALDGGTRSADVAATRRTQLWRIPRAAVIDVLASEPVAAIAIIAELGRRLRDANDALHAATLLDLGARLARLLLSEAGAGRIIALTQTEIARRLNASREKVNRKLHAFVAAGLVSLSRAGVRIENRPGLAQLVEQGGG